MSAHTPAHCYIHWIPAAEIATAWWAAWMSGCTVQEVDTAPCQTLRVGPEAVRVAAPGLWARIAPRQAAWHAESPHAHDWLLVSGRPLPPHVARWGTAVLDGAEFDPRRVRDRSEPDAAHATHWPSGRSRRARAPRGWWHRLQAWWRGRRGRRPAHPHPPCSACAALLGIIESPDARRRPATRPRVGVATAARSPAYSM